MASTPSNVPNPTPTVSTPTTPGQAANLPKDQPASGVPPLSTSRPGPTSPEHPASPGGVTPPGPTNPNEPNPQHKGVDVGQAKTPEEQKMGNMPTSGSPSSGTDKPSGLTPDKDVKQRQGEVNAEFLRDQKNFEAIKGNFTMLYPMPDQKVHNPVTAQGEAKVNMDAEKPKIEVRLGGHNKKATAIVESGKWAAHFDVLPTGKFDFELWVNDQHHSTHKAEIVV